MTVFRTLLLALAVSGCKSETDLSIKEEPDTGYDVDTTTTPLPDTGCAENGCLICTNGTCEIGVMMYTDDIVDCFWNYATNDWIPGAPVEIRGCPPGTDQDAGTAVQDECWVILDKQQLEPTNTCGCEDRDMATGPSEPLQGNDAPPTDPSGCCSWEENTDDVSAEALYVAFEFAFRSECQVSLAPSWDLLGWSCSGRDPDLNEMVGPTWGASIWGGDCCGDEICLERGEASTYAMQADPAASYVALDVTPLSQSFVAPVRGAATLDAAATQLLAGSFRVDDATLGLTTFAGWIFSFGSPIGVEVEAGNSRISGVSATDARILGRGQIAILDHGFTLTLDADALGTLDLEAGRWSLEHTEASALGEVTLHLEGAIAQLAD